MTAKRLPSSSTLATCGSRWWHEDWPWAALRGAGMLVGPPQLLINSKVAFPSGGPTYNGMDFVSSGILALNAPQNSEAPPTYRLTFTRPGTYEYDCLVHPHMEGIITVLP